MSAATLSMAVWTAYVFLLGAVFLLVPNVLLSFLGIPETDEVWIRLAGLLLIGFGLYYMTAIRADFRPLYVVSAWGRFALVATLVVLAFTIGPWQLVLFAIVDFLGGLWTFAALRSE
jgi:hypothetical protein